jgi:hypothetical protein
MKDGKQVGCSGSGTIAVFDGAHYAVDITGRDSTGNYQATLTSIQSSPANDDDPGD